MFKKVWLRFKTKLEGGKAFSFTLRKYYIDNYGIEIGYGTYGGCFDSNLIPKGTSFGNYCSIGENLRIFRANHPINYFTTHPIFYNPQFGYVKTDQLERPKIEIGHDVWIGANVIITPNVKYIGNGAIIGAGSVVTKDVEKYSIVAGNPAKIIRKRFSESQIKKLEDSKWFDLKRQELVERSILIQKVLNES